MSYRKMQYSFNHLSAVQCSGHNNGCGSADCTTQFPPTDRPENFIKAMFLRKQKNAQKKYKKYKKKF